MQTGKPNLDYNIMLIKKPNPTFNNLQIRNPKYVIV
jgi:hypothetical protein